MIFIAAFVVGVALVGQRTVRAASSASATATATAFIVQAITIANNQGLDFGEAAQGTAAKTVATGDGTAANFTVTGEGGHAYTVTLPSSATMLRSGGTPGNADDEIAVGTFVSSPSGAAGSLSGTPGTSGTQVVYVGATRALLPLSQAVGSYTTNFSITVAYP